MKSFNTKEEARRKMKPRSLKEKAVTALSVIEW